MRPLGAWFFGRMADRHGRRVALTASVLLMCFGSAMIAVLPTYESIGVAAPVLLLVARLVQGLSLGGEYGIERYVSLRNGNVKAPRILFELPVRDADRRAALGYAGFDCLAEVLADGSRARSLGLAHSFCNWRASWPLSPYIMRRDMHETDAFIKRQVARRNTCRLDEVSARACDCRRLDHGRHGRVLYVHDLHAEVPRQHIGFCQGYGNDDFGIGAVRLYAFAAGCRRHLGSHRAAARLDRLRRFGTLCTYPNSDDACRRRAILGRHLRSFSQGL